MSQTVHRSENLIIQRESGSTELSIELRFPSAIARGKAEGSCPRCGSPGHPEQWEVDGPEGTRNTVWLSCLAESCGQDFRWTRPVSFGDWHEF